MTREEDYMLKAFTAGCIIGALGLMGFVFLVKCLMAAGWIKF